MIQTLQLIVSLSLLVFFHELGHFFFSRINNVRVEKFYLFFNPYFSLLKLKKVNGKYQWKIFAKNTETNFESYIDYLGNTQYRPVDIKALDDNDWRKYPENTEWGIGWLPLGGYCKIAGMIDESMDKGQMAQAPQPWEYRAVSPWKRLPIISGGVLVNFIMALVIYSAVLFTWGERYIPMTNFHLGMDFTPTSEAIGYKDGDIFYAADREPLEKFDDIHLRKIIEADSVQVIRNSEIVSIAIPDDFMQQLMREKDGFALPIFPFVADSVLNGSSAQKAGILPGDSLIAFNDKPLKSFFDFVKVIEQNKNKVSTVSILRDGKTQTHTITPDSSGRIGIFPKSMAEVFGVKEMHYSFIESYPAGVSLAIQKLSGYVSDMKYITTKEGVESLGGFKAMGSQFSVEWNWQSFWELTAFFSVALAFMNFLPIPGLDGGHLMFLLYEIIIRRKPNEKFVEKLQLFGILLLLTLVIFVNLNDFI